jgi:branched-chain amino acid transport system ATP-binding protein
MNMLETKKITKHFDGVYAVDGLSVGFEKGKITGLIGPNGSGKSTLINLLTGVIQINTGSVIISSKEEVSKILPHEVSDYGITRTFQEVRLFEQMPVLDNILVVLTKRNVFSSLFETHKKFHLERAEEVLKKVDLWQKRNDLAKNLSYGQRKLLEVGRMLAMSNGFSDDSDIFFLDEPFAGVDPIAVEDILSELCGPAIGIGSVVLVVLALDLFAGQGSQPIRYGLGDAFPLLPAEQLLGLGHGQGVVA